MHHAWQNLLDMVHNAVFFICGEIYELGQPLVENTSPLGCQMLKPPHAQVQTTEFEVHHTSNSVV
jgi:hypothetical protein